MIHSKFSNADSQSAEKETVVNFPTLGPLNEIDELIQTDVHSPQGSSTMAIESAGLPDPGTGRSEAQIPSPVKSPGDRLPAASIDDEKDSQIGSEQEPGDDPIDPSQPEHNIPTKNQRLMRPSFSEKLQIEINDMKPPGPCPPSGTATPQPWSPPQSPSLVYRNTRGSPSPPVVGMSGDVPHQHRKLISVEQTKRLDIQGMTVNSEGQAYISNSERPTSPIFIMNGPATATRLRSELIRKLAYSPRDTKTQGEDGARMTVSPQSPTNVSPGRFRASSAKTTRGPRRPAASPAIIMDDGAPSPRSPPSHGGWHKAPTPGWSP